MSSISGSWAAAVVGGILLLGTPEDALASGKGSPDPQPFSRVAAFSPGSIQGVVLDEGGRPIAGAMVSALGATTTVAVTDREGRFELRTLSPGPYLVRAHLSGYVAPRAHVVDVQPSARSASTIALRRAGEARPLLAAGVGEVTADAPSVTDTSPNAAPSDIAPDDETHTETAWRLRHARRGVLRDAVISDGLVAAANTPPAGMLTPVDLLGRAAGSSARLATSLFAEMPVSGQVNFLTAGSFESPQQLFSGETAPRGITFIKLSAPVGSGDWTVRGALMESDLSSWIVAGSYKTRAPATHSFDVGLSYSTQRYGGGNPLALRDVTDGSRNVGGLHLFDTFTITPAVSLTYGTRFVRYDYLDQRNLISPRVELTLAPARHLRVSAMLSQRATAPGAEEFLPPSDGGIWLPPQRTFSSLEPGRPLHAESTTQAALEVERDLGRSTITLRTFRQHVDGQLVTLFGVDLPGEPIAKVGHYFVANAGGVNAAGCAAGFKTSFSTWMRGSFEYSLTRADLMPAGNVQYLLLTAPSAARRGIDRVHDVTASVETNVPETSTRVMVLYRVSNGFIHPVATTRPDAPDQSRFDSRFDVQVRQSLPFMDFASARWEMLVGVRDFFRYAAADRSVYDELLVLRPPKRIVGGLTMHF